MAREKTLAASQPKVEALLTRYARQVELRGRPAEGEYAEVERLLNRSDPGTVSVAHIVPGDGSPELLESLEGRKR